MGRNLRNVVMLVMLAVIGTLILIQPVLAQQYGGEKIGTALDRITDWLTKILGGALVVIGIVIVGIRMSMHDEQALKKGIWVIVGGLLIFLSKTILALIKGIVGV